jgi:hypothetical protein
MTELKIWDNEEDIQLTIEDFSIDSNIIKFELHDSTGTLRYKKSGNLHSIDIRCSDLPDIISFLQAQYDKYKANF